MNLNDSQLQTIGRGFADGLARLLTPDIPQHVLLNLARDPDWLDRMVDETEAANFLAVRVSALQAWRTRGGGPHFVRPSGRLVRYCRRDLLAWQRKHTARTTGDKIHSET